MSLYRVSLLDILHSKDAPTSSDPTRVLKGFIALLYVANIAIASALVVTVQLKGSFSLSEFLQCILSLPFVVDGSTSMAYFFDSVSDCFWMAVLQLVLFPLIAWGAVCTTRLSEPADVPLCSCGCYRCFYQIGPRSWRRKDEESTKKRGHGQQQRQERVQQRYQKLDSQGDRAMPLLDSVEEEDGEEGSEAVRGGNKKGGDKQGGTKGDKKSDKKGDKKGDNDDKDDDNEDDDVDDATDGGKNGARDGGRDGAMDGEDPLAPTLTPSPTLAPSPSLEGFEAEDKAHQADTRTADESYLSARSVAHTRRTCWLALLFVVSTLMQCYLGLKCISFEFHNEATEVLTTTSNERERHSVPSSLPHILTSSHPPILTASQYTALNHPNAVLTD
jgi:hypothetical protein